MPREGLSMPPPRFTASRSQLNRGVFVPRALYPRVSKKKYIRRSLLLSMPRGWDWLRWIAIERNHSQPTEEDQRLARRMEGMDREVNRQRRFAFLMLFKVRLLLIGLLVGLVLVVTLLDRVSNFVLALLYAGYFAFTIVCMVLIIRGRDSESA
jgi:uncharacterized membrane protein